MAKAYLVADVTVNDMERYSEYIRTVPVLVAKYGGKYLVRASAVHPLEGELEISRVTIVEFESMDVARRFYESAEYAPLLKLRTDTTRSRTAFVEGFVALQ
jgi:uncharacterized protein (DUF1330 family)